MSWFAWIWMLGRWLLVLALVVLQSQSQSQSELELESDLEELVCLDSRY